MKYLCVFLLLGSSGSIFERPQNGNFLQGAAQLKMVMGKEKTPESFCRYAVFVMDYYSFQVNFQSFYFRDLSSIRELHAVRNAQDRTILTTNGAMIELNLPDRLIESLKKDPDDLYFQFSVAYYSWKGRNLAPESALIFSPLQVKDVFTRCWKKDIYTSESLLFLAIEEMKEHAYSEKACELLEKSYELRSGNFAVDMAYLEMLIHKKKYEAAMPVAQNLVDFSQDRLQKQQILNATARLFFLKKDYQRSLVTCKKILTLFPGDTQALWVSLDCYRALNSPEDYLVFLGSRIRFNNFESYLVYLSKRNIIPWDHNFYDLFQTLPAQEKEPAGWRSAFSGFLKKEMGESAKALEHFRKALNEVKKEDPENKGAIEGLKHEIEILDKKPQTP